MKKILGILLASVMATSCIHGNLDVKKELTVNKKSGFLYQGRTEAKIKPGLYSARLHAISDKNYTLKVNLGGNDNVLIPIKGKNDLKVPYDGKIAISHNEIGQPFDVQGDIDTSVRTTERVRGTETCSVVRYETVCRSECDRYTCHQFCQDVSVSYPGYRDVEFHNRITGRDLSVDLVSVDKQEVLASFHGNSTSVDRIYDYYGVCR